MIARAATDHAARPGGRDRTATADELAHGKTRHEIEKLQQIADLLDARFAIPGLGFRFGLDTVAGLIPGIGDTLAALPAAYIILRAQQLGASKTVLARMVANAAIDLVIGSVPLFGDLFDVGFKSNRRNVALLRRHLAPEGEMIDITPKRQ